MIHSGWDASPIKFWVKSLRWEQLKCISWWPRRPGEGAPVSQSHNWLFWSLRWWQRWQLLLGRPWSVQTLQRIQWAGWCSSTVPGLLTWPSQPQWSSPLYLWKCKSHLVICYFHNKVSSKLGQSLWIVLIIILIWLFYVVTRCEYNHIVLPFS